MKLIHRLITLAVVLAASPIATSAVPSAINYQGRLTNATGVPQPGTRTMSMKVFDAATSGTQLYAENMGSVAVDANGVYSFQFGATGTSNTLVSETLATTDGTALTYSKALSNTPVIAGSASVTDGTYSWTELTGNPGSRATATATTVSGFVVGGSVTSGGSGYSSAPAVTITGNGTGATATATVSSGAVSAINITSAGSGYTTGATITIASPPAPFVINYTGGAITATYASAPAAGKSITATYRYTTSGISGALAAGSEQWLELTVDGVAQSPRQKVLAVPFAMKSGSADNGVAFQGATTPVEKDVAQQAFTDGFVMVSVPGNLYWNGNYCSSTASIIVAMTAGELTTKPIATTSYKTDTTNNKPTLMLPVTKGMWYLASSPAAHYGYSGEPPLAYGAEGVAFFISMTKN